MSRLRFARLRFVGRGECLRLTHFNFRRPSLRSFRLFSAKWRLVPKMKRKKIIFFRSKMDDWKKERCFSCIRSIQITNHCQFESKQALITASITENDFFPFLSFNFYLFCVVLEFSSGKKGKKIIFVFSVIASKYSLLLISRYHSNPTTKTTVKMIKWSSFLHLVLFLEMTTSR